MNNENKEIRCTYNEKTISIEIPIDTLIFAQENNPEFPVKITDKRGMLTWVSNNILEFNYNEDDGSTRLTNLLDDLFTEALESGELWLESIDWENKEDE